MSKEQIGSYNKKKKIWDIGIRGQYGIVSEKRRGSKEYAETF